MVESTSATATAVQEPTAAEAEPTVAEQEAKVAAEETKEETKTEETKGDPEETKGDPQEETKEGEGAALQKHESLRQDAGEAVELIQIKGIRNLASPFINQQRDWDDVQHVVIPQELQKGITEELGFIKPSNIQAVAIPLISQ